MGKHSIAELKALVKEAEEAGAEEVDVVSEEVEDEAHEEGGQSDVEASVEKMAERIGEKIANALVEKHGGNERDKENLAHTFNSKGYGLDAVEYPSDVSKLTDDEKIVTFFKALVNANTDLRSNQIMKALVEGTPADGGYLVPEILRAEVYRILPDMAVIRRIARVIPMTTDTTLLTTLAARPSAYWTSEYASKSTTSAEFGRVTLSPNKLVCLLPVTQELLMDANINMVNFIIELFAEEIGRSEDRAYAIGSGVGQPTGIGLAGQVTQAQAVGGALAFDDIITLIDLVPQRVSQQSSAAFMGNRYVKRIVRQMKDGNNNYIWREGGTQPGAGAQSVRLPDTLYGYPFYEQNDLAQSELYFGDWKQYAIGDRQELSVTTTTEGGDAWRRDSMEIKAKVRVDGIAILPNAFAKLTGI